MRFGEGNKAGTGKDRSDLSTGLSLRKQVDQASQVLQQAAGGPGRPGFAQVLHAEATWPRSAVSRELPQDTRHHVRGNLVGQGQGIDVNGRHGLDGVQSTQCRDGVRSIWAKAGRKKGIAGFTVKALPGQGHSKIMLLLLAKLAKFRGWLFEAVVPKTASLPLGPALQTIHSVGCGSTAVPSAASRWGAQHTLGEHEQFSPSLGIVVVHSGGKRLSQDAAPEEARSRWHMSQGAGAPRLDVDKGWQVTVAWARVGGGPKSSTRGRPASRVRAESGGNTETAHPASLARMVAEPLGRHLALQ